MNQLKSKYVQEIDVLIKTKISEINMAMYISLVKQDSYQEFVTNLYNFLSYEIKKLVNLNLKKLNVNSITDRLDELLLKYLENLNHN